MSIILCWNCDKKAVVVLALDGDTIVHEPACMDCAAPLVSSYMAEIVEVIS